MAVTLLRLGRFMKTADYNLALSQYQEIIDHHNDGIYIDEALFFSAEIYKKVERRRKAKPLYEKIIFNHETVSTFGRKKASGNCGRLNL
jgi:tetratricopeptide (TPR) repeat protein